MLVARPFGVLMPVLLVLNMNGSELSGDVTNKLKGLNHGIFNETSCP